MIDFPEPVEQWLSSFSALSLVLTLLATLWTLRAIWRAAKGSLPSLKRFISFVEALMKLPVFMATTEVLMKNQQKTIDEVRHEVLPNDGNSMRDELTTLGFQVDKVSALQEKDFVRIKTLETIISARVERARASRVSAEEGGEEDG